jgi:hypothetical protein
MKVKVYMILYPPGDGLDVSALCFGSEVQRDEQLIDNLNEIFRDRVLEEVISGRWDQLTIGEKCHYLDENGHERPTSDDQEIEITNP